WRWLWPRDPVPDAHPSALEPADRVHDRRAFKCATARGRILRLGTPRYGQLLGISGSVALAGCFGFRHGDLPDAVRRLPDSPFSVVFSQSSRGDGRACGGCGLLAPEHRWRESRFDNFAVAVLCPVVAVLADCAAFADEVRRTASRGHHADNLKG